MLKVKHSTILRWTIVIVAVGLLVFLFFYSRTAISSLDSVVRGFRVNLFSQLSFIGNFISKIKSIDALTRENIALKEKNQSFASRLSYQKELEEQNNFLRESLSLPVSRNHELFDAGVFDLQLTPEGYHLLINKGSDDGIKKDDIVATSSGILVGVVDTTYRNYSRVASVTDVNFKATVEIYKEEFNNPVTGIARGAGEDGIRVDFIAQDDDVSEDDTVVTSGNDTYPSGLVVGKVSRVSSVSGSLFKDIGVKPAMSDINISRVLVLR